MKVENVLNKTLNILNLTLLTYYLSLNVILLNCIHQNPTPLQYSSYPSYIILLQMALLTLSFFQV